jgi:hypothetical protein
MKDILSRWFGGGVTLQVHETDSIRDAIARFLGRENDPRPNKAPANPSPRYRLIPYYNENHTACATFFEPFRDKKSDYDRITKNVDVFLPPKETAASPAEVYEAISESNPHEKLSETDLPFLRLRRGKEEAVIPLRSGLSEYTKDEIDYVFNAILAGSRRNLSPLRIREQIMDKSDKSGTLSPAVYFGLFGGCCLALFLVLGFYVAAASVLPAELLPIFRLVALVFVICIAVVITFGFLRSKGLFSGSLGPMTLKFGGAAACLFGLVWLLKDVIFGTTPTFDMTAYLVDEATQSNVSAPGRLQLLLNPPPPEVKTTNGIFELRRLDSNLKDQTVTYSLTVEDPKYELPPGDHKLKLVPSTTGTPILVREKKPAGAGSDKPTGDPK